MSEPANLKEVELHVKITFEDEVVNDDDIEDVAKHALEALINESQSGDGLAPDFTWTTKIEVDTGNKQYVYRLPEP
jgi:hypothetical protein